MEAGAAREQPNAIARDVYGQLAVLRLKKFFDSVPQELQESA
jgi:hypothetical protein